MIRPDISVVICTRSRPEHLKRCLSSLGVSTTLPLEVIIIDQSDNQLSAQIVTDCESSTELTLRYLQMEDTGHTKARNLGIISSRGDIVAFTDDDCTISPTWIEELGREFAHLEVSCVCGQTEPMNACIGPRQALLSTIIQKKHRLLRSKQNPISIGRGNNIALRKADLIRLGGFNENIGVGSNLYAGDDMDLLYRLLESGGIVACTNSAIVYHRQPNDLPTVLRKKRGYSISSAAILASRFRCGDIYAGVLLAGKATYEVAYLLCGGIIRMNRVITLIGWHSFIGSLSGLKHALNGHFCRKVCPQHPRARIELSSSTGMNESESYHTSSKIVHCAEMEKR